MTEERPFTVPLKRLLSAARNRLCPALVQYGALPYRMRGGEVDILLITSLGRGVWGIPKGWPIEGAGPAGTAAVEAWEEAGLRGIVEDVPFGEYRYVKRGRKGRGAEIRLLVFPMAVEHCADDFPEMARRKRRWLGAEAAAATVEQAELAAMILRFAAMRRRENPVASD